MFAKLLCVAFALSAVQASGDFVILHSPDSVTFTGNKELPQSLVTEVFAAALGFTVKQRTTSWNGMSISDPFNLPEAVTVVAIEGIDSIPFSKGKHYPMNVDEVEETTWQVLSCRLEERDNSDALVRISLEDGVNALGQSALGELKFSPIDGSSLKYLSLENDSDKKFLDQIQLLNAISEKVSKTNPDHDKRHVYWFVLSAMPAVLDFHGKDSAAAKESFDLLNQALTQLSSAFMEVFREKVLIAMFTNNAAHIRHTRAANPETLNRIDNITSTSNYETVESSTEAKIIQDTTETYEKVPRILKSDDIKISKAYDANYPVMFNIFLWFGVAFVFALIAVCITIADMDPGRDSIIYRMTSNRMKKDN